MWWNRYSVLNLIRAVLLPVLFWNNLLGKRKWYLSQVQELYKPLGISEKKTQNPNKTLEDHYCTAILQETNVGWSYTSFYKTKETWIHFLMSRSIFFFFFNSSKFYIHSFASRHLSMGIYFGHIKVSIFK